MPRRKTKDIKKTRKPQKPFRKKVCRFCTDKVTGIDFKDIYRLRNYVSERGKILPSRISGTCSKHQRQLSAAIKRARQVALLPFTAR